MAVESPLLETTITGATDVILNVSGDVSLQDAQECADYVEQLTGEDINVIFGCRYDNTNPDTCEVTVIATGLSENAQGKSKSQLGTSFGAGAFKTPAPAVKPAAPVSPAASASETAAPAAKPSFRPGADITSSVKNQSLNIPSFLRGSDSRRK